MLSSAEVAPLNDARVELALDALDLPIELEMVNRKLKIDDTVAITLISDNLLDCCSRRYFVGVGNHDEIIRFGVGKALGDPLALIIACLDAFRESWRKIVDNHVNDFVLEGGESMRVVEIVEGLRLAGMGLACFNEHEMVDDRGKLVEPDLEDGP